MLQLVAEPVAAAILRLRSNIVELPNRHDKLRRVGLNGLKPGVNQRRIECNIDQP